MVFLTILAVIVIFSILVLIHEYGHFIAARRAGIKVIEFGIGFPPRLFKKKVGETVYSVNAIPFGGFVKLYGEDATDADVMKDKRSFASKSPWIRTKVVCAGVFMNFVLAIALLTLGFTFGIEPLLMNQDDLFYHIGKGNVSSAPGIFVAKVSDEAKKFGVEADDKIVAVDDTPVTKLSQAAIFKKGKALKDVDITVKKPDGRTRKIHIPLTSKEKYFGIELKPFTEFPAVAVLEVKDGSASDKAGFLSGDLIFAVNGKAVYEPADFDAVVGVSPEAVFTVLRGAEEKSFTVRFPDNRRVAIAEVFEKTSAESAGFQKGDVILKMDSAAITSPEQIQQILKANPGKSVTYRISRGGKESEIRAEASRKNFLGVALSSISSFRNSELSVYRGAALTSITEIKKVSYSPWKAFKQAISESVRLTGVTVAAFGRTIATIISKFAVPDEIGGPVQIAFYTHAFIQEGFFALLRFTALLSLSLAVINVLPIPALDGGRFLFIVIEVLSGRRVNARLETMVHSIGFVLLLLLIVLVTYSDITKLF